jgi:hypothetical protein
MKRLTFVLILLVLMVTAAGCRRGSRMWGSRGGLCGPDYPPPPVAVTPTAPTTVYAPATTTSSATVYSPATTSSPPEVYPAPVPTIEAFPQTIPETTIP